MASPPDPVDGFVRLKTALLSPDQALLAHVLAHDKPFNSWIQHCLASGDVLPQHIALLHKTYPADRSCQQGLNWYLFYDVWARKRHCALFEALCNIKDQPWSLVAQLFTGMYFSPKNILQWCPCCCAKLFADAWIGTELVSSLDNLLYWFGQLDAAAPLPDWLVKLFPRTKFSHLLYRLGADRCLAHLHTLAKDRDEERNFIRQIVIAGPPRALVQTIRKIAPLVDRRMLAHALWHTHAVHLSWKADPEWPLYIQTSPDDARTQSQSAPMLAAYLDPEDVCFMDAVHCLDKEAASAAAAVLEQADPKLILSDKTLLAYVLNRANVPLATRRVAGEVAVHLLLFTRRKSSPWCKLDPWLIRHIVSFYI